MKIYLLEILSLMRDGYCNTREFLKNLIKKQYKFVNSVWT